MDESNDSQSANDNLRHYIRKYPYKSYSHYKTISPDEIDHYHAEKIFSLLKNPHNRFLLYKKKNKIKGMIIFGTLPWDTEQFGIEAGTIHYIQADGGYTEARSIKKELLNRVIAWVKEHDIKHLTCRINSNDLSSLHMFERNGLITIDGLLTFSYNLDTFQEGIKKDKDVFYRPAEKKDKGEVVSIAAESFMYDRFHSDPALDKKIADRLHAEWLKNSFEGLVDGVMVAEVDGEIAGFNTIKIDSISKRTLHSPIGAIVLVAVRKKQRNRGIAAGLAEMSLGWLKGNNIRYAEVGTQFRNIPASRMYSSIGFNLVYSSLSLRACY